MDFRKDSKARGRQHLHNKKKYNPQKKGQKQNEKLQTNKIESSSETKNQWESNAWRYETSDPEDTSELTNFEVLSQAPMSEGGHFQFKSDKQLDESTVDENTPFCLDLNLLAKGLEAIPFYVRSGLDETLFEESELELMKTAALKSKEVYNNYLLSKSKVEPSKSISSDKIIDETNDLKSLNAGTLKQLKKETIDTSKSTIADSNIDLEQWLDDILDD